MTMTKPLVRRSLIVVVALVVSGALHGEANAARVEEVDGLPIVFLEGSPYEMGRQHGELLREAVRQAVGQILGYFRHYVKMPIFGALAASWWLDRSWGQARSYVPEDYLEELRGLADGSGVRLRELWRLHAIPDRTYACASLAAWGRATAGGKLIHTRNLDWNIDVGIQQYATVFVVRPTGKQPFVSVGWAGLIGVLTGVNSARLSIGQIGAETLDTSGRGVPMVFLMRRVLEEAGSLEEAARIVRGAKRTVGVNYVVADAKVPRAVVIETTRARAVVFEANDPREHGISYARPIVDAVLRADTAIDAEIRNRQLASKGNPDLPGLESPAGSAYETRYLGQAEGIRAHYGALDVESAMQIARTIAPDSNVQSVIFAWPQMWVANAEGTTPAAHTAYRRVNVERLLTKGTP